jgi:hypothetical protein
MLYDNLVFYSQFAPNHGPLLGQLSLPYSPSRPKGSDVVLRLELPLCTVLEEDQRGWQQASE